MIEIPRYRPKTIGTLFNLWFDIWIKVGLCLEISHNTAWILFFQVLQRDFQCFSRQKWVIIFGQKLGISASVAYSCMSLSQKRGPASSLRRLRRATVGSPVQANGVSHEHRPLKTDWNAAPAGHAAPDMPVARLVLQYLRSVFWRVIDRSIGNRTRALHRRVTPRPLHQPPSRHTTDRAWKLTESTQRPAMFW